MLKRVISKGNLLLLSAGGMVGASWLFSPYISAQIAGPWAMLSWLIASVFMLFIALPLCELSALFPMAGGMVNYPGLTHGRGVGFLFSWTSWLAYVVCSPIEVQAVMQYASYFFPSLVNTQKAGLHLSTWGTWVAILVMFLVTLVNYFGVRFFNSCSRLISIFKFIVPSLAIIGFFMAAPTFAHHMHFQKPSYIDWHHIFSALSFGGVAFAFTGFQNGLLMAGEVKNPKEAIPLSLLGSILVGFVLYACLQWSFIIAIPDTALQQGWNHLNFSGDSGPLVGLALILGLGWIASLLMIDASISPLGTTLVYSAATARILYAMGLNREIPLIFSSLNHYKVPAIALGVNFLVGSFSFLPFSGWQNMVAFLSSCSLFSYLIGPICLMSLRKYRPDLRPSFRLKMHNMFCFLGFYAAMLMLLWCGFAILWKLVLALIVGLIIYCLSDKYAFIYKRWYLWFFVFLAVLLLLSYLSSYGGIAKLVLPYDMLALLPISYVFLRMSVWMAVPKKMLCLPKHFQEQLISECVFDTKKMSWDKPLFTLK